MLDSPHRPIFDPRIRKGHIRTGVAIGETPAVHGTATPGAINVAVTLPAATASGASAPSLSIVASISSADLNDPRDLVKVGNTIYMCAQDPSPSGKVLRIDVTNPLSPSIIDSSTEGLGGPTYLVRIGNWVYMTSQNVDRLWSVDTSSTPDAINFATTNLAGAEHIATDGTYLYIACDTDRLTIYSVSGSTLTSVGSVLDATALNGATAVAYANDICYVGGADRLAVVNVSTRSSPSVSSSIALTNIRDLIIVDDLLYVARNTSDTVAVYDISTPASPSALDDVTSNTLLDGVVALADAGNGYVLAAAGGSNRVTVVDGTNPASLATGSSVQEATQLADVRDIIVDGNYAYASAFPGGGVGRLTVISLS